jgi:hypothetical protein
MACSIEHPVDVQLVRILNVVVALSKGDIALISVHSEDLILRDMEGNQILDVLCCTLVLQVAESPTAWYPRVAVVGPDDHLTGRLLAASIHGCSNPLPDSACVLMASVLADLVYVIRVPVVLDPV